ncbi:hypothetical protein N9917_00305 [Deltaproteobacteria bacterium]|nr:hypothetical protein [Deltaproteobacteria bacterium]
MFKLTMVNVVKGNRRITRFVRLPVCPETGKVRVDYFGMFNIRRQDCVLGLGR